MLEIYFNTFNIADSFLEESRIFIFNEEQAGWKRPNLWISLKQFSVNAGPYASFKP